MANISPNAQTDEYEIKAKQGIRDLLKALGENPEREGLIDTPKRVFKAFKEMTSGYDVNVREILKTTFESENDNIIEISEIPFVSLCEHHMLPFYGTVKIKYKPKNGKVVGLSKIPRTVEAFAKRLQIQEKMTREISEAIQNNLDCQGVEVEIKARHMCMELRGIKCKGSYTKTTFKTGCFLE
nr:MAG TPA: GTP cyclohydrolase I [Caudoviricetes sp.]